MTIDLIRIDPNRLKVENAYGVDATLLANEDVYVDRSTLKEVGEFLSTQGLLNELGGSFSKVVFSPDLHKGAGIPVGTSALVQNLVIPKAVGTDIGCGMRLTTLPDFDSAALADPRLDKILRHRFFEGGRRIGFDRAARTAIFQEGLAGLARLDRIPLSDAVLSHNDGSFVTEYVPEEYLRSSGDGITYDDQIGSIGGGNHFVEVQLVESILDPKVAFMWGLHKGTVCVMSHSGSVSVGTYIGKSGMEAARKDFPKGLKHPEGDYYPTPNVETYMERMKAAANFAFANRYYLTRMVIDSLEEFTGKKVPHRTVYDAPHNLAWNTSEGILHRKGSCPADHDENSLDFPLGHPVIVPGSMGDYSYVLVGHGNEASLCSACHGAGRKTARTGSKASIQELDAIRVITKMDPDRVRSRPDIIADYKKSLAEEAPSQYKDVEPAIQTCLGAGVASPVARLKPLFTIKGY